MLRTVLLFVTVPLLVLVPLLARRRRRRPHVHLPDEHPAIAPAIERARSAYPEFLRLVAHPPAAAEDFCVRVRIAFDGGFEHCWFGRLEVTPYGLTGVLHTGPTAHANPEFADPVLIPEADVTDWGYMTSGRAVGYFTTREALRHSKPAVRRRELARLGWDEAELTPPAAPSR